MSSEQTGLGHRSLIHDAASIGPIDGLNYRILYNLMPLSVSESLTLPELKHPEDDDEDKKKAIIQGAITVVKKHHAHTEDQFIHCEKYVPEYVKSCLKSLLSVEIEQTGIDYEELFDLLQTDLGGWLRKNQLKHLNSMSRPYLEELARTLVKLAKAESTDTDQHEKIWKFMPTYIFSILTTMLHKE
uniref:PV4 n=1 Tax=European wheat striate mosaic virus TaxID=2661631 RepID=A0A5P9K7P2_9VIRU|nr:pV4 [European wheat striate mosaic virus]